MKIKVIILTIITLLAACKKDKTSPEIADEDCYDFENMPDFQFISYVNKRFEYMAPYFNPNNPNEFIYHFRDNEQEQYQLYKYNLQTEQKTLIVESGKIWRQPKWSSKGWIAFTHHIGYVDHIYIVKDNGDSLIQFTENTANYDPAWSASGDELYWVHTPIVGGPRYFLEKSLNNEIIDTLLNPEDSYSGSSLYNEISSNNHLLSLTRINDNPHIAKTSLNELPLTFTSIIDMFQVFNHPNPNGLCWSNDGESIFITSKDGLYKIDVNSVSNELLIPFCNSKAYGTISASSDGKYLIGERGDSQLIIEEGASSAELITERSIYLIDLQTLEETKIDLE
jgi:hypothetical protein